MTVRVQKEDFDLSSEVLMLRQRNPNVGAVASFIGVVRDFNNVTKIQEMELEHYPGMTEKTLAAISHEAKSRWNILDTLIIHRFGALKPTDQIVLVAVTSAHRGDAFRACEFIMDFLKTQAPFWKKELTETGSQWVSEKESDNMAADRWT